jgi:hypothetical protein
MSYASRFSFAVLGLSLAACAHTQPTALCAAPAAPHSSTLPVPDHTSGGRFVVLADQAGASAPSGQACAPAPELYCDQFGSDPTPGCDTRYWIP